MKTNKFLDPITCEHRARKKMGPALDMGLNAMSYVKGWYISHTIAWSCGEIMLSKG